MQGEKLFFGIKRLTSVALFICFVFTGFIVVGQAHATGYLSYHSFAYDLDEGRSFLAFSVREDTEERREVVVLSCGLLGISAASVPLSYDETTGMPSVTGGDFFNCYYRNRTANASVGINIWEANYSGFLRKYSLEAADIVPYGGSPGRIGSQVFFEDVPDVSETYSSGVHYTTQNRCLFRDNSPAGEKCLRWARGNENAQILLPPLDTSRVLNIATRPTETKKVFMLEMQLYVDGAPILSSLNVPIIIRPATDSNTVEWPPIVDVSDTDNASIILETNEYLEGVSTYCDGLKYRDGRLVIFDGDSVSCDLRLREEGDTTPVSGSLVFAEATTGQGSAADATLSGTSNALKDIYASAGRVAVSFSNSSEIKCIDPSDNLLSTCVNSGASNQKAYNWFNDNTENLTLQTNDVVGNKILALYVTSQDQYGEYTAPNGGALIYIYDDDPIGITVNNPNTKAAPGKVISATDDLAGETVMEYKIIEGTATCDVEQMAEDTQAYTEGENMVFIDQRDNGKKVCFKTEHVNGGGVGFAASSVIGGIDDSKFVLLRDFANRSDGVFVRFESTVPTIPILGKVEEVGNPSNSYEFHRGTLRKWGAVHETITSNDDFQVTPGTRYRYVFTAVADEEYRNPGRVAFIATAASDNIDYDSDDDNLIEISNIEQLKAIQYDLNGNGAPSSDLEALEAFNAAFPGRSDDMGCPQGYLKCLGFELTQDLDFDTNGDGAVDSQDDHWNGGEGFVPLGDTTYGYNAIFEGNGHTIRGLRVVPDSESEDVGLFGVLGDRATVRRLGIEYAHIDAGTLDTGRGVGILVGHNKGTIESSYVTGSVSGAFNTAAASDGAVGGLVGKNEGNIFTSYALASVSGNGNVGGLVGSDSGGTIGGSYASSAVQVSGAQSGGGLVGKLDTSSLLKSYARSVVQKTSGSTATVSGLATNISGATITDTYYDNSRVSGASDVALQHGHSTIVLSSLTGYTGIYANWNAAVNGLTNVWDLGTTEEYPLLKIDFNQDGTVTVNEFGLQRLTRNPISDSGLYAPDDTGFVEGDNITNNASPRYTALLAPNTTGRIQVKAAGTAWPIDDSGFRFPAEGVEIDDRGRMVIALGEYAEATYEVRAFIAPLATGVSEIGPITLTPFTVDLIPPAPDQPRLSADDDTGFSDTDGVTKNTQNLSIEIGNIASGAEVQLYNDGVAVESPVRQSGGGDSVVIELSLTEGTHNLTAIQTDPGGHKSEESAGASITVDITPVVAIIYRHGLGAVSVRTNESAGIYTEEVTQDVCEGYTSVPQGAQSYTSDATYEIDPVESLCFIFRDRAGNFSTKNLSMADTIPTIDVDGSSTYEAERDGQIFYGHTTGASLSDLLQYTDQNLRTLIAAVNYINRTLVRDNPNLIDFDGSGTFDPQKDAAFLYYYTIDTPPAELVDYVEGGDLATVTAAGERVDAILAHTNSPVEHPSLDWPAEN